MAKVVKAKIRLQIPGGGASPAPPVGSALGQQNVNIMDFCQKFNAKTGNRKGETVPVVITVYKDKSFDFVVKTPLAAELIRKKAGIDKGASNPGKDKSGKVSWTDIEEIAKIKLPDLNAFSLEEAKKIIAGTARSMGIEVVD